MPKKRQIISKKVSKHEINTNQTLMDAPKAETNGVISGYHSNETVVQDSKVNDKVQSKTTVTTASASSAVSSNDVLSQQQSASNSTQPPIIPPLVLPLKATKTEKKSQNSIANKKSQNKDDVRQGRVTRHSPQNTSNNTEANSGSPSKSTAANATNGRTNSTNSPSTASLLSPNKTNARQLPTKQVFAHKRSPSSPVPPNPFINSNQVRATKSKPMPLLSPPADPTPNLKANFIAAQKSRAEANSVPKVETKRPKRKLETKKSVPKSAAVSAASSSSGPALDDGETRASKRVRLQYQPFQSPEPLPPVPFIYRASGLVVPKKEEEEKVIIYHNNEFLAVRNETNGFYICRAKQNVFKNSRKFKIQWFNNDKNPLVYTSDFYDVTDFECILTNLTLFRLDNGQYELPDDEKQRILNILQRAINVEKGINERPDPIKVTADGVDVSVVGKVDEKELLKKISPKRVKKETIKSKKSLSSSLSSGTGSTSSTPKASTRISKRNSNKVSTSSPSAAASKTMATRGSKPTATRRSNRAVGVKSPTLSPASSSKSSPKDKKPGIAEVVKKLKTRARTAKKLEAKYTKKSMTPNKKTKKAITPKKKSPKGSPLQPSAKKSKPIDVKVLTPSPKAKKRFPLQHNPNVTLYEKEPLFETHQTIPFVSTLADSKLLIRAVLLKDYNLLEKLMNDKKKICSFCVPRCLAINRDAISYAIEAEDLRAIKMLTDDELAKNLAPFPDLMISNELTGRGSRYMFGHALRNVNIGRGGKEGNNALLKDSDLYSYGCGRHVSFFSETEAEDALRFGIKFFTVEKICAQSKSHSDETMNLFLENIVKAVRCGHYRLAHDLVERAIKRSGFGFNELHRQSLSSGKQFTPFRAISICKKAIGNSRITPIHCAAINPDPYFLTTLLTQRPDYGILDLEHWSPVHYAAVSEGSANLEFLLNHGVSTLLTEKEGNTPLHLACRRNRVRNVELILRHESNSESGATASTLEKLNRAGFTPLHIAAQEGFVDVIKALLKAGADAEKPTATTIDKLTPLMVAAESGRLSVVKLLNECGVNIEAVDKRHRTSLTHAVMNGQSHIVSYLLRLGANPNTRDSSGNTLVHYACAYGWYFCFKLLLEAKALINDTNDWKMTPLCIAFMKGHTGLAEVIIKDSGVNIDMPVNDTTGMNLLMQTCESKPNELMIDRLKFLIERGADCTKTDYEDNNALHYLVENESQIPTRVSMYSKDREESTEMDSEEFYDPLQDIEMLARKQEIQYLAKHHKEVLESQRQKILEAAQILIDKNCDPNAVNKKNMSPFMLAAKLGAFSLLHKLLDLNRKQLNIQTNSDGNSLLHLFVSHASTEITVQNRKTCVAKFIRDIYETEEPLKEIFRQMSAIYNKSGLKPIHLFLTTYSGQYSVEEEESLLDFLRFLVETLESDINSAILSEKPDNIEYIIHLTSKCKTKSFVELILSKKPLLEQLDGNKRTALTIAIINKNIEVSKLLIESGADVKFKSETDSNQSLLLLEAINNLSTFELIPLLVSRGALVNESDVETGNTALHYIGSRAQQKHALSAVEALIKAEADINAVNKLGRTPLHLSVNSRGGGTDVSFEVEECLLKSGAKIDIRDQRGRIPLHYAFVKIGSHNNHSFMDPIELVALLVPSDNNAIQQPSSADVADNFGSTPLHYAAQRGATISCMHLFRVCVDINPIDNNDNTPLGLAVLYGHEGCALMLQQKGASFVKPIGNLNRKPGLRYVEDKSCWKWNRLKDEEKLKREIEAKKANCSIIEEVVRNDWQGILYLMINDLTTMGRGVSVAIESALKTNRLNLAIKLLKRLKTNKNLNPMDQTLLHVMAKECQPSSQTNDELQLLILKLLVDREVQPLALDSQFKSNAIIYAAINWNSFLCNELTKVISLDKIVALEPDSLLRTPVSAIFWDLNNEHSNQKLPTEMELWLTKLLEKNPNQLNALSYYPINESTYAGIRAISTNPNPTTLSNSRQYSPLIYSVICGNYSVVKYLLNLKINGSFAVDINFADNLGRTPLMHSVRLNDLKMVKLLLNRSYSPEDDQKAWDSRSLTFENKNGVDLTAKDKKGSTVLHYLVSPLPNYTYLNSDVIVRLLWHVTNNSKPEVQLFDVPNDNNETPLQMAISRNAKNLIKTFNELLITETEKRVDESKIDLSGNLPHFPRIETHFISEQFDYKLDSNKMIEKIDSEAIDVDDSEPLFKPDGLIAIDNANVVYDTTLDLPFDTLLTKVDLEYGIYGLYNFYKMQIIEQKAKDLVILFTRWGRIGDIGQYQKTPFTSLDEAIREFKKVFKTKTGNNWESVKQFNAVPKKYRLVDSQRRVKQKQRQYKIDVESAIKSVDSKLPDPLFQLMKTLISVHSRKDALRSYGNGESFTPFGLIKSETLSSAETILNKIEKLIEEKESIKQKDSMDYSKVTHEIIDLSEQFYHLIPLFGYQYERLSPILSREELRDKMELISNLNHFEFAYELVLGAQLRANEVNPTDYIYRCLNSHLQLLDRNEEESQLILQYIHNTGNNSSVKSIFRINRNGEEETFNAKNVGNNWLLWHGTKLTNVLSILANGLKKAPLSAQISGHLFGKGIYFADMFTKSQNYCSGFGTEFSSQKFMFLCEVSLGNVDDVRIGGSNTNILNPILNNDKHSLKTSHTLYRPDPQTSVYWKGRSVPLGPSVRNQFDRNEFHELNHNEYIVFNCEQICLRYLIQFSD